MTKPTDDFGKAFDDALIADEQQESAEKQANNPEKPARKNEKVAKPDEAKPEKTSNQAENVDETDYKAMYEREQQRLRSLEGRFKREREQWLAERRKEQAENDDLATEKGEKASEASKKQPTDLPRELQLLRELVREEAMNLFGPIVQTLLADRHVNRIETRHPDWREMAESLDLQDWIDSQPSYLSETMRKVAQSGDADQVIDLLDRFKRECPRFAGDTQLMNPQNSRPGAESTDVLAADRLQQLSRDAAALRSRPVGPPASMPDRADFRGAWSEAINQGLQ